MTQGSQPGTKQAEALIDAYGLEERENLRRFEQGTEKAVHGARAALVSAFASLEAENAYANDAAAKGELARANAAGMEMRIAELEAQLESARGILQRLVEWYRLAEGPISDASEIDAVVEDARAFLEKDSA